MSSDLSEFHDIFFDESSEALDGMETDLLGLQPGEADVDSINNIFRGAHSMKGGAGMFGFTEVVTLTHVLETLLDEIREGKRVVTQESIELLLQSVDCLREMFSAIQSQSELDHERIRNMQSQLENLLNNSDNPVKGINAETDTENQEDFENTVSEPAWKLSFKPEKEFFTQGFDIESVIEELTQLAQVSVEANIDNLPAFNDLDTENCHIEWLITLSGNSTEEQIRGVFKSFNSHCEIEQLRSDGKDNVVPLPQKGEGKQDDETAVSESGTQISENKKTAGIVKSSESNTSGDSIRVGTEKIDAIVNLVGELIITQSMLSRFGDDFNESDTDALVDGLNELTRHTRELQDNVLQIRMLPISFCFNRFPRLVRDLSNKLGKKMELRLQGENTELDKTVLEKIGDPLVHLIRNSIDHGIEAPPDRLAAGKPETGVITLNAYHAGGDIIIEIHDDGNGISKEKVLSKAIERNIVSEDDELSDDQIRQLIFAPGFSTADEISDVSGRGVGMDVVRRNIKSLGGTIDIQSEEGKGSTFRIRLPLTLAILDGLLVRVGSETYIISLVSITESIQFDPSNLNTITGNIEMYRIRENYIPIIRLHDVFSIEPVSAEGGTGLLVIIESEGMQVGLFVDDLIGQQQVVIKSLEANYKQVEGISGATILGDGTVSLILDVPGLIKSCCNTRAIDNISRIAI